MQIKLIRCIISFLVNKHKPWIETSYHGIITENNDTVILDPPLVALDKDAPVPYAGRNILYQQRLSLWAAHEVISVCKE